MRKCFAWLVFAVIAAAHSLSMPARSPGVEERSITRRQLEDKIRGGWAGQMIGVAYGAPTEFKSNGKIIETNIGEYRDWTPERVRNALGQDDLYVEMTFTEVMDRAGLDATTEQYGEAFKNSKYSLWHANAAARRLLVQGVKAPLSGHPRYNIHANDIDFQIESDFIGLMTPGLPREANKFAERVGRVMNHGDGLYGGMFVAGMYAAAFFERDPRRVVELGWGNIPRASGYARIIRDVLDWSQNEPDWTATWRRLQDKWDKDDSCTDGALRPFNIDARLNGAYIALGLLYGGGDFFKTLDVSTRAGQDSDCNPSSAVGVLGVMLGYEGIPAEWKVGLDRIADQKFDYTEYSFDTITRSTVERALKVVERAGGRTRGDEIFVPVQKPRPPALEQWDMGVPVKVVSVNEADWKWNQAWAEELSKDEKTVVGMRSNGGGSAEATLRFNGTAVALVGPYAQDGGRADVFLDGRKVGAVDAFVEPRTSDNDLWHAYGLAPGEHTLRVVARSDADARSAGRKLVINRAIIYRAEK